MPRSATTGIYTRVSNSFSQPVFGTLIDPADADAYFDDLDVGLNPPNLAGPLNVINPVTIGKAGATVGTLGFFNATSGSITLSPPTGALGTVTLTLPAATDTLVGKNTTDVLNNKSMNGPVINGGLISALTGFSLRDTSAAFNLTFTATSSPILSANRALTINMQNADQTLATQAAAEEFTNKTLNASVGKGTWTVSGTWTLPAFTLGGTVSGGGQQLNNIIIGTVTPLAGSFTTLAASGLISANGGQIAFPAVQNPSANVNTLDDYEEGTWTPVYTYATPGNLAVAYSIQVGVYTKIGRLVIASFVITTSTHTYTTASGSNQITGLPFTSANTANQNSYGPISWEGITKASYTQISTRVVANSAVIDLVASGSGQAVAAIATGDCPTGTQQTRTGTLFYVV